MAITKKLKKQIETFVNTHFKSAGHWWVDDQGVINATGLLSMKTAPENHTLPYKFGHINGDFLIKDMKLTSLINAPHTVTGWFDCSGNLMEDLQHAPTQVGAFTASYMPKLVSLQGCSQNIKYNLTLAHTKLRSLEGLSTQPHHVHTVTITHDEHLPLLRLLVAEQIMIQQPGSGYSRLTPVQPLQDILNDPEWVGKGKQGMLNCALALKKAGYEGNAKW